MMSLPHPALPPLQAAAMLQTPPRLRWPRSCDLHFRCKTAVTRVIRNRDLYRYYAASPHTKAVMLSVDLAASARAAQKGTCLMNIIRATKS